MIICFNGIDGSGKSLQAQLLVARLHAEGYPAVHVWTGGKRSLRRPFIWLGKRLLRAGSRARGARPDVSQVELGASDYTTYLSSTEKMFKHRWLRVAWEHLSMLEHALEIWFQILPHLLRGRIVICDRYLHDTILRIAVLAHMDAAELPGQLQKLRAYRVPTVTLGFLIDVPAEVAMSRQCPSRGIDSCRADRSSETMSMTHKLGNTRNW